MNREKERLLSPRKVLGACEQEKRGRAVTKEVFCAHQQQKSPTAVTKQEVM
jgi:hypothetical protein